MKTPAFLPLCCLSALLALPLSVHGQGAPTPGGPPGPTMKTLDQIEPRIDLATLPGDSTALVVITQPGSYYLSGNLTGVSGRGGIRVAVGDVNIDLRGFSLIGVDGALNGVDASGFRVAVRNGTITGWDTGVSVGAFGQIERILAASNRLAGIAMSGQGSVQSCTSAYNGGAGYAFGDQVSATDCVSFNNVGAGFTAGESCTLLRVSTRANGGPALSGGAGCTVLQSNATSDGGGFSAGANATFRDSSVRYAFPGFSGGINSTFGQCNAIGFGQGTGILTSGGAIVTQCSVSNYFLGVNAGEATQVKDCSIRDSVDTGILAGRSTVVAGCTIRASNTTAYGINGSVNCSLQNCIVSGGGAGIYTGYGSTVSGCSVNGTGANGIETAGASTVVGATVTSAGNFGVAVGVSSSVLDSTISSSARNGVVGYYTNLIARNNVSYSGTPQVGCSGIATAGGCRVEDNLLHGNTYVAVQSYGVYLDFIFRNVATGNAAFGGSQFSPSSGAYIGTVTSPNSATANSFSNIQ
ncbi:MAG: right-handed parallel beta-helix repeat-containing protein [Verrucomicrobia bacterium]|nr:right-handed parallel beta-helix repeat-containing protein [Verrucomicrobiota bacterium]